MLILLLVAAAAGALLPVQAGINAGLRISVDAALFSALASFVVGTVALFGIQAVSREPVPALATLARVPLWQWTGGLLGVGYVVATILLAPRLGASAMIAAVVAGQMLASILLDHFGVAGYPVHPASAGRILGVALVVAGVLLIRRF